MISGFAVSGMALLQKRPEYIEIAVQAAEFVRFAYNRRGNGGSLTGFETIGSISGSAIGVPALFTSVGF